MSGVEDYLAVCEDYCRFLGGLRWCATGEAVESISDDPEIGITFAMAGEISLFVQGFHSTGRPIAFAFHLHLLHLLGRGTRNPRSEHTRRAELLEEAFREQAFPFRNAGALCGFLCRDVPAVPEPPELSELCVALTQSSSEPIGRRRHARGGRVPPLEPAAFEERIFLALSKLSLGDLRHWLRFGRPPVGEAGSEVARALPRTLSDSLLGLTSRPRLAGAGPLVANLAGSLALPPRKLAPAELPLGGYADVATRGLPEQILPAQLALDGEEFVRRFVQQELLYYRREEPRARVSEEMVVVVDQGVRTWGEVRLLLAAAVLVFARQAERKGIAFQIATTGQSGPAMDAVKVPEHELGSWLEASDLSSHPGLALRRVLEQPGTAAVRDVILLTHARNLDEPAVVAAAQAVGPDTRLFAVGVDGEGNVAFSELRQGVPVVRSRCRVDLSRNRTPRSAVRDETSMIRPWSGDVETPGWPFPLGALHPIPSNLFDFDDSGEWILFAGQHGLLHAWRVDGTCMEMLPRALVGGRAVDRVLAILGVAGGFVVSGRIGGTSVLTHYDFSRGRCTIHPLSADFAAWNDWSYHRRLHTVVAHDGSQPIRAVDLDADPRHASHRPHITDIPFTPRAIQAVEKAMTGPRPDSLAFSESSPLGRSRRAFRLDPETGAFELCNEAGLSKTIVPQRDGRPALKDAQVRLIRAGGDIVAALIAEPGSSSVYLVSLASFSVVGVWPLRPDDLGFALSRDGKLFARKVGDRHLEVRSIPSGPAPLLFTPKGKTHPDLDVELSEAGIAIRADRHVHWLNWELGLYETSGRIQAASRWQFDEAVATRRIATIPEEGSRRYRSTCPHSGLTAQVDFVGHVSLFDSSSTLICMFHVFRDKLAVWMPDGTRLGPESMIGGPPTPGARERVFSALRAAAGASRSRSLAR